MPQPNSSFANPKNLHFVIQLAQQRAPIVSNGQNYNTITLDGLRSVVRIDNAGGAMMGTLTAQIYGLTDSQMNALTSPQWDSLVPTDPASGENLIQVIAIDGNQETVVYNGQILNAWGVYTSMPDVYLYIQAMVGYYQLVVPSPPLSIAANTKIATAMQQIANAMGYQFENNGVSGIISKGTYVANTLMEQARNLMMAYRFWMYLDSTSPNTLAIAPNGTARAKASALISPQTGLIGYPMFNRTGINFDTLFNPAIVFGGPVQVQSSLANASGTWIVQSMTHSLSCQVEDGPWQSTINAVSSKVISSFGVF